MRSDDLSAVFNKRTDVLEVGNVDFILTDQHGNLKGEAAQGIAILIGDEL